MTILAADTPEVQRDAGAVDESLPELLGELRIERADPFGDRVDRVHEERSTGEVERDLHQRLVERDQSVREPAHAPLVAERVAQRVAEHDPDVFDRVVQVDVEITLRLDPQVESGVLAELFEHVVEERNTGRHARRAGAVDRE